MRIFDAKERCKNNNVSDKRTDTIETLAGKQGGTALLQNIVILKNPAKRHFWSDPISLNIQSAGEKSNYSATLVTAGQTSLEDETRAVASNSCSFGPVCIRQRKLRCQILLTIRTSLLPLTISLPGSVSIRLNH